MAMGKSKCQFAHSPFSPLSCRRPRHHSGTFAYTGWQVPGTSSNRNSRKCNQGIMNFSPDPREIRCSHHGCNVNSANLSLLSLEWERIIEEWVTGAADHPLLSTVSETAAPNPGYQTTCCPVPQCSCNVIFVLSLASFTSRYISIPPKRYLVDILLGNLGKPGALGRLFIEQTERVTSPRDIRRAYQIGNWNLTEESSFVTREGHRHVCMRSTSSTSSTVYNNRFRLVSWRDVFDLRWTNERCLY
ncbi:hypothetical protein I7I51_03173 [Histoplasma capsulatum]|uniref:Uncharacterized protein n=1 Tax=Ajellomyces capsulatus TaxID=5037 RepID=A0A8A1MLD7_AJECA|nr:hypothetical protein I7I51_03173 [Histoplasma capsulatum]